MADFDGEDELHMDGSGVYEFSMMGPETLEDPDNPDYDADYVSPQLQQANSEEQQGEQDEQLISSIQDKVAEHAERVAELQAWVEENISDDPFDSDALEPFFREKKWTIQDKNDMISELEDLDEYEDEEGVHIDEGIAKAMFAKWAEGHLGACESIKEKTADLIVNGNEKFQAPGELSWQELKVFKAAGKVPDYFLKDQMKKCVWKDALAGELKWQAGVASVVIALESVAFAYSASQFGKKWDGARGEEAMWNVGGFGGAIVGGALMGAALPPVGWAAGAVGGAVSWVTGKTMQLGVDLCLKVTKGGLVPRCPQSAKLIWRGRWSWFCGNNWYCAKAKGLQMIQQDPKKRFAHVVHEFGNIFQLTVYEAIEGKPMEFIWHWGDHNMFYSPQEFVWTPLVRGKFLQAGSKSDKNRLRITNHYHGNAQAFKAVLLVDDDENPTQVVDEDGNVVTDEDGNEVSGALFVLQTMKETWVTFADDKRAIHSADREKASVFFQQMDWEDLSTRFMIADNPGGGAVGEFLCAEDNELWIKPEGSKFDVVALGDGSFALSSAEMKFSEEYLARQEEEERWAKEDW